MGGQGRKSSGSKGKAGAKVQRQEMKALAPEQPGASWELVVWCGSPEDRKGH